MRQHGFTLLEILVALAVLGFLMASLSGGLRFGVAAWATQARLVTRASDLEVADRALRHILTQLVPTGNAREPGLRGIVTGFEAITELPDSALLPARRAAIGLGVDRSQRLVLRWTPWLHARRLGPAPVPQESTLLEGVARLEVAYWSRAGAGGWLSAWDRVELPDLVRIRLIFADRRRWPDIVAAPMCERLEE